MKICIIGGGGAIGGFLAVQLARAGNDVTVVARGVTYEAIKKNGLKLITDEFPEGVTGDVRLLDRVVDAGIQDLVILTMKAHQLAPIAEFLPHVIGPDTVAAGVTTTLAANSAANATSLSLTASVASNTTIQVSDSAGANLEWVSVGTVTGSGPYTAPVVAGGP